MYDLSRTHAHSHPHPIDDSYINHQLSTKPTYLRLFSHTILLRRQLVPKIADADPLELPNMSAPTSPAPVVSAPIVAAPIVSAPTMSGRWENGLCSDICGGDCGTCVRLPDPPLSLIRTHLTPTSAQHGAVTLSSMAASPSVSTSFHTTTPLRSKPLTSTVLSTVAPRACTCVGSPWHSSAKRSDSASAFRGTCFGIFW